MRAISHTANFLFLNFYNRISLICIYLQKYFWGFTIFLALVCSKLTAFKNLQPEYVCIHTHICIHNLNIIRSDQISRSVVSESLRPHESRHAGPPCPSPTPGVHSDSRPSSQWCHPAISSSVIPFSSCPQSLPASECFPMSQLFAWGGQSLFLSYR